MNLKKIFCYFGHHRIITRDPLVFFGDNGPFFAPNVYVSCEWCRQAEVDITNQHNMVEIQYKKLEHWAMIHRIGEKKYIEQRAESFGGGVTVAYDSITIRKASEAGISEIDMDKLSEWKKFLGWVSNQKQG